MGYKISAAARDAYAAMDQYIDYMARVVKRPARRVYINSKQKNAIITHLNRVKSEQVKNAERITTFTEYKGCQVVIYEGK